MNISFTVNRYDYEGDIVEKCIMLHFDEHFIIELKNMDMLNDMIKQLNSIKEEISENYAI